MRAGVLALAAAAAATPVWPDKFNTTEIKFTPTSSLPWGFTQTWYDWSGGPGGLMRFTFVPHEYNYNGTFGEPVCHIFFRDWRIVFADPVARKCSVDHPGLNITAVSPTWLSDAKFIGNEQYRMHHARHWQKDTGSLGVVDYWETTAGIPLASTNQNNDPGVSAYQDFTVGPAADPDVFKLPNYCAEMGPPAGQPGGVECPPNEPAPLPVLLARAAALRR
eukprot:TRINITY_DN11198_c0_g1_i1.p1 TRINITY_DN11198_c0_g1~~TRINITY_DN11198_c0_g1_i1.p1  ORF type:complete len:220 (+),score=60.27 TRINITY_DN11198_c0_g1_i1:87-746(+)